MSDFIAKSLSDMSDDQVIDEFQDQIMKDFQDALVYGIGPVFQQSPYPGDLPGQNRIYSSILKKYVDAKTGEPIEE